MIKGPDYYRQFDLDGAAKQIASLGSDRGNGHEVFEDAIASLLQHLKEGTVRGDDIVHVLGHPDSVAVVEKGEVWRYDWIGSHGPNQYLSYTPFLIIDGICVGLDQSSREADDLDST